MSLKDLIKKSSSLRLKRSNSTLRKEGQEVNVAPRERNVLRKNHVSSKSESRIAARAKADPGPRRNDSNRLKRSNSTSSKLKLLVQDQESKSQSSSDVYWPLDFLPNSCPNSRILTYGCQTLSTNGKLLPAQLDVFGHGDEMLHDLAILREKTKTKGRSLVFIAHSLGGIVVKEVRTISCHHISTEGSLLTYDGRLCGDQRTWENQA